MHLSFHYLGAQDFVGVIKRVKAVMLVAQSLAAVAALSWLECQPGAVGWRMAKVPESVYRQVAFMRVWCLVELMAAKMARKPMVMLCGSAVPDASSANGYKFVADFQTLNRLQNMVDVATAQASDPVDQKRILAEIELKFPGGMPALSADISGWICGAAATEHEVINGHAATAAAVRAAMLGEPGSLEALPSGELGVAVRMAAALGAEGALARLLGRGAPVDELDSAGWTALMRAARAGWDNVVVALVGGGAEVDFVDPADPTDDDDHRGPTALFYAAEAGRLKAVEALLAVGASVNMTVGGFFEDNPLCTARRKGHKDVVAVLVAAGAKCANQCGSIFCS